MYFSVLTVKTKILRMHFSYINPYKNVYLAKGGATKPSKPDFCPKSTTASCFVKVKCYYSAVSILFISEVYSCNLITC